MSNNILGASHHYPQDRLTSTYEICVRFKCHGCYTTNRMKATRPIWQSSKILVGMATDELNLERNGEMYDMKSLCIGS